MAAACRSWWRNCAMETDAEIADLDAMEGRLAPLDADVIRIRELISTLEICHHKAERWVESIIEAIGAGKTSKGLGTRSPGQVHPAETIWQNACAALSAWCAGTPADAVELPVGPVAASTLLAGLGQRSPLKEWQVQRVIDKIHSLIGWPQSDNRPDTEYAWLLLGGGEYELAYRDRCPARYAEHEDFWQATVRTIICDTVNGRPAELSLGLAIDMLWPCHRRFVTNLQIVLDAIGGRLAPNEPFAACGRNIRLISNHDRMDTVSQTLQTFCGTEAAGGSIDEQVLAQLGEPTDIKRWLARSLDKTIRLQADPPAALEALSALEGPAWIRS